ncbi:hypothetical protein PGT21_014128 [Puccinia graminis f. sp. tritici]|uniref:Uncharacterized protein n=1 Tax=Puccinia graminis f. sp. tritici TaxID=56615 RepID=A0A5B0QIA6_PUCGR|nr:hypothetical protein PGT21_014128 [Puccinia graminis f. sp. tritici]
MNHLGTPRGKQILRRVHSHQISPHLEAEDLVASLYMRLAGRIEKSRSATKAQPELADIMAPRAPVKVPRFRP